MKLIKFPEHNCVYAEHQPYQPLPAYKYKDREGTIAFCWKLTLWERVKVLFTGVVWHRVLTFDGPLQPQMLSTSRPAMPPPVPTECM